MAATEQLQSRSIGWDDNDVLRGTRIWLVDGAPPTAKNDPELPATGTEFPGFPELKLDLLEATYFSPTQSRVTGTYTTDGSGTYNGTNPTSPTYASWAVDVRTYDQTIPYFQVDPVRYSYTDVRGATPVERFITGYHIDEEVHTETRVTISRRVIISSSFGIQQLDAISSLSNSLIKADALGQRIWRFIAGPVEEVSPGRWQTTYTFEDDPGTPNIFPVSATLKWPRNLRSVIPNVYTGVDYARPPFHKVVVEPGPYDPGPPPFIGEPRFVPIPLYPARFGAHETLPGWR